MAYIQSRAAGFYLGGSACSHYFVPLAPGHGEGNICVRCGRVSVENVHGFLRLRTWPGNLCNCCGSRLHPGDLFCRTCGAKISSVRHRSGRRARKDFLHFTQHAACHEQKDPRYHFAIKASRRGAFLMALVIILCVQVAVIGSLWLVRYYTWVKPSMAAIERDYPVDKYKDYLNALNIFISKDYPASRDDLSVHGSDALSNVLLDASLKLASDMRNSAAPGSREARLLDDVIGNEPYSGIAVNRFNELGYYDQDLYYKLVSPPVIQARNNLVLMLPNIEDVRKTESAKVVPQTLEPLLIIVPLPLFLFTFILLYYIVRSGDDRKKRGSKRPPDNSTARWLIGTMVVLFVEVILFGAVFLSFYEIRMAPRFDAASRAYSPAIDELTASYASASDPANLLLNPAERNAALEPLKNQLDQTRNAYDAARLSIWQDYNTDILLTFLPLGLLAAVIAIVVMWRLGMTGRRPPKELKLHGEPKPKPPKGNSTWIPPGSDD